MNWPDGLDADWLAAWAAILTAFFTGYTAWQGRQDRKRRVTVEWKHEISHPDACRVICTIRNQTDNTLRIERAEVSGPVKDFRSGKSLNSNDKHPSWGKHRAPVSIEVKPRGEEQFSLFLYLDPSPARSAASIAKKSWRSWLARKAWQWGQFRLPSGVKFSIKVIAYRSSSNWRPIRLTHKLRIHADTVMQMAQQAE